MDKEVAKDKIFELEVSSSGDGINIYKSTCEELLLTVHFEDIESLCEQLMAFKKLRDIIQSKLEVAERCLRVIEDKEGKHDRYFPVYKALNRLGDELMVLKYGGKS